MSTRHITYCRNCASNCGMILEVDGDRIVGYETDRENPASEGYMCIKGQMAIDLHNGDEPRLITCMRRGSDGKLHPVDRLDVVDEIADRLSAILAEHGPRSLAMFFGTTSYLDSIGKPFARSFMSEIGSPNIFSSMTVDQSSKWVTAGRMGAFVPGKPSIEHVDLMLLAGNNPQVSHQGYPMTPIPTMNVSTHIKEAKKRGVKFIVIDPRRTEMARFADVHLQPYPGHDTAIFAALIRLILDGGLENKAFCARYVTGIDELRKAIESFTPERVADEAGIKADDLRAAATLLGAARKPCVGSGTGPNMAAFANTSEHLTEALNAILGGYVLAGEPIANPGIFSPRVDVEMVVPPNRTWEQEPKCRSADFGRLMGEFPASILPDEILLPGKDKIRAMFVVGANPIMCLSDPDRVHEAFRDLDLLVTFDPRISGTAKLADYVIAPSLQFERAEVTAFTDYCFPWPFAQYTPAAKAPPPGTMGEWEFFWRLARRMGVNLTLKHVPFGVDYNDGAVGLPIDPEMMPEREELIGWLADQTAVPFEMLKAHPHGYMSGITNTMRAPEHDNGARLDVCPPDVAAEISGFAARHHPHEAGAFVMTPRRIVESFNSMFQSNDITQRKHGTNRLYIHPDDMARLGVAEDDGVRIRSPHGNVVAYVRRDPAMKRGVVSMTHGWGAGPDEDPLGLQGAHVGRLISMSSELQPINRMPLQSGFTVDISRLGLTLGEAREQSAHPASR